VLIFAFSSGYSPDEVISLTGIIKKISISAVALALIVMGCRNSREKKMAKIPPAVEHSAKDNAVQKPYFYGLIEEYRGVLAEDPNNLAAIVGLGNAYSESGAYREAIEQYQQALKIDPQNADVHTDMGNAFRNLGMIDRALTEYRNALAHEPGHLNARYNMGIVYAYDLHDYNVAVHIWEELLRIAPNHPQADYMRNCIVTFKKAVGKRGS
jgi:tetratricopeptide (TPR) repeat protein